MGSSGAVLFADPRAARDFGGGVQPTSPPHTRYWRGCGSPGPHKGMEDPLRAPSPPVASSCQVRPTTTPDPPQSRRGPQLRSTIAQPKRPTVNSLVRSIGKGGKSAFHLTPVLRCELYRELQGNEDSSMQGRGVGLTHTSIVSLRSQFQ